MERCEKCGSANTLEILLSGSYNVCAIPIAQRKKVFPKHTPVKAVACADCGAVFGLKLEQPEKFRPFVNAGY